MKYWVILPKFFSKKSENNCSLKKNRGWRIEVAVFPSPPPSFQWKLSSYLNEKLFTFLWRAFLIGKIPQDDFIVYFKYTNKKPTLHQGRWVEFKISS
jgi:hypothetical protein